MKTTHEVIVEEVKSIICDRCGREDEVPGLEAQEYLTIDTHGGYGSVIGDMASIKLDLCQHCLKEVLGPWLRVKQSE